MDSTRRIAVIGMVVSGLLGLMKITAGLIGQSASVLADGFESAADVFTSGLVFAALTVAARPADSNHPYGHGRVETLTGFVIGFFLFDAGALIAWHGYFGAADVTELPHSWALWPLAISIGAKLALTLAKHREAVASRSEALKADAANDALDMLSGFVALVALSLTLWKPVELRLADHYGACLVGLIVIGSSLRVMHEAANGLIDTMPDNAAMQNIRQVALSVPEVLGVEKCFARKTGLRFHVDLHLEVDPDISVMASHNIAERVRDHIRRTVDWVEDVLVHVEPFPGAGSAPASVESTTKS